MAKELAMNENLALLASQSEGMFKDAGYGATTMPDSISIRNGRFWLVNAEGRTPAPDQLKLTFVTLAIKPPLGRQYFEGPFDADNPTPPVCSSFDGVTPEDTSPTKQSETCGTCPKSFWGSSSSQQTGKAIPACRQHKEIVIKVLGIDGAWLLRIPPKSIKPHWAPLVEQIKRAGEKEKKTRGQPTLTMLTCVVEATFDDEIVGVLHFTPRGYISEQEQGKVLELIRDAENIMRMLWGPEGSKRALQWSESKPGFAQPANPTAANLVKTALASAPPAAPRVAKHRDSYGKATAKEGLEAEVNSVLDSMGMGKDK